jgi:carbamoyl-phosphate synthase small subunit
VTVARPPALLVLEDGSAFFGRSFGAEGEAFGEAVFNTGMAGYQEVLTDPSYAGQIVTMTSPHQGNYGLNEHDPESWQCQVAGFAVREASRRPSNWRATSSLHETLASQGVPGIDGIDTRRLTLRIRSAGAMRAAISTVDLDPTSLSNRARKLPPMAGADLARSVSAARSFEAGELTGPASAKHGRIVHVAAVDFGLKRNILRSLAAVGIETTVFPAQAPAAAILSGGFDGVVLTNGPGDPEATRYGIEVTSQLLGSIPIMGICLGHQLLAHALGGRTFKMKFGHRGVN